ncbi:hypothetical protein DUI87_07410 [Hirundo rustica rustica]|uniref:PX domain-containing protein n=1 Tax=Hirundo rustica rustica TaxID=333673 RepID=A0A3M0KQ60_HIRRU|nr:hypothetical protein DUI87_07410 [Hirundo rustica rustica]
MDTRSQLSVIRKFTNERLNTLIHVTNKNIEQNWPQHRPLRDPTGAWLSAGCSTAHHHSLGPAIQPVPDPAQSAPVQAMGCQLIQECAVGDSVKGLAEVQTDNIRRPSCMHQAGHLVIKGDQLKDMFPGFRLALPPKRWFKDNYNPDFLEDRQLGLQAFLQNLVAHKDIANCLAVREFLCLDDPPGPFDSLEESRAFCETLEETNYRLQKELLEKQREVESLKKLLTEKQLHIDAVERRIRDLSLGKMTRQMSGEESECSGEVESSAVEADQGALGEDSCSDKENHGPCWSGSLAGSSVPEIEVAEVAYTADEE